MSATADLSPSALPAKTPGGDKLSLVVFSGELDRTLAAFVLATSAAAMDWQVSMFFTFWGLKLIQRPGSPPGPGWMRRMLGWMVRPGTTSRPLSKLNMGGMGPLMMKSLMRQSKVPSLPELFEMARESGVKMMACTMTMGVFGVDASTLVGAPDGQLAGAAAFLQEAKESTVTLFI